MNTRKAIVLNAILYLATFVLAALINALKGAPLEWTVAPDGQQIFVAMVTGIVLTTLGAWWFFRTEPASAKRGLVFGIIAILTGFVIDGLISVGIWTSGQNPLSFLQTSYSFWFFGFMLFLVVMGTSLVGWVMEKKKSGKITA